MSELALLISPEAKSAYFHAAVDVAQREFAWLMPELSCDVEQCGPFTFLLTDAEESQWPQLARLSFCQGLFLRDGDRLMPLTTEPQWALHDDFVFGSKFRGKTNERLTQLLLNVGLAALPDYARAQAKVLDPMAGRATTLLWSMRYGLDSWGIESDTKARGEVRQIFKKWCKIHRQKHQVAEGVLGNKRGKKDGQFLELSVAAGRLRLAQGDARDAPQLFPKEKFDLLVSDLPYGVQHLASGGARNPLTLIEQCLPGWKTVMKKHSCLVLAFNTYMPNRGELEHLLAQQHFEVLDFSAAHRMSESIVRDVIIARPQ